MSQCLESPLCCVFLLCVVVVCGSFDLLLPCKAAAAAACLFATRLSNTFPSLSLSLCLPPVDLHLVYGPLVFTQLFVLTLVSSLSDLVCCVRPTPPSSPPPPPLLFHSATTTVAVAAAPLAGGEDVFLPRSSPLRLGR